MHIYRAVVVPIWRLPSLHVDRFSALPKLSYTSHFFFMLHATVLLLASLPGQRTLSGLVPLCICNLTIATNKSRENNSAMF
ncbi:hypothetical protein K431DRAFT_280588 [Polychaeton citri CBS 116435]|uniref:Uncharacterized protein n=1 Tax=Polychaeton citri CBS 116435 TaxID=1314669 RepID=A0A9P4QG78_9PEZI|nr:hypothetical protein K431DRAFT_280588 [Polychaeton citri CBS 116435]